MLRSPAKSWPGWHNAKEDCYLGTDKDSENPFALMASAGGISTCSFSPTNKWGWTMRSVIHSGRYNGYTFREQNQFNSSDTDGDSAISPNEGTTYGGAGVSPTEIVCRPLRNTMYDSPQGFGEALYTNNRVVAEGMYAIEYWGGYKTGCFSPKPLVK